MTPQIIDYLQCSVQVPFFASNFIFVCCFWQQVFKILYHIFLVDVQEHSLVGKHLLRISAYDPDRNAKDAKVLYYLDDLSSIFSIRPSTGK